MRLRTRVRTRKIDDFNISMDENRFKGWLRETVENYCKDTIKRKKAYIEILEKMPMDDFCEADEVMVVFIRNELRMDIERVLKIMPCKEYAECIRLIYLDHKLPIEVAKALGKTTRGSFDTLHTRAKLQFKQVYKKEMGK